MVVKSDERSPLEARYLVVLSWLFHCEHWSGCVTYFCGQEMESGHRVYCVLCHALDCTVPGPARTVRHLQSAQCSSDQPASDMCRDIMRDRHETGTWDDSDQGPLTPGVTSLNMASCSLTTVLILVITLRTSDSFNLETRVPVVKVGGDYANSFFGYSVAQHRTGTGEPVLLVGAPQDRNLQPGTNSSGALYRCPVTSSSADCVQVVTDGKRHNFWAGSSRSYHGIYDGGISNNDLKTPISSEIKDGQWLGVAVSSQGEILRLMRGVIFSFF